MENLIEIKNLKTYFSQYESIIKAVDGVSFNIKNGSTLGVVGESGCGKSVTAQSIMRIEPESARIVGGDIMFYPDDDPAHAVNITKYKNKAKELDCFRGQEISMIFQEPMSSLSPVYTVGNQVDEAVLLHQHVTKKEAREITIGMFKKVGISKPEQRVDEYPHQLSGGMRQRVMIAMALCCRPKLLIADEPTTALDVTVQAQILDLLLSLQSEFGMSIMIISHNLGIIATMAKEVVVMYLGKVVETAPVDQIFHDPLHPYTTALLRSIPKLTGERINKLETIVGSVPSLLDLPKGCTFHPRCEKCMDRCRETEPQPVDMGQGHKVSCLLYC
jgi:peptide/nickel transport system ATP-binding protein